MVMVRSDLVIPEEEIRYVATPSSGPGGQNVNKVSTRVTLLFDVLNSQSLNDFQRGKIQQRLAGRINDEGVLRVICQVHRTQKANKEEALNRFIRILQEAFHEKPVRHKTHVPAGARARRLETKHHTATIKQLRGPVRNNED